VLLGWTPSSVHLASMQTHRHVRGLIRHVVFTLATGRRHLRVVLPRGGDQNAFRGPNLQQPLGRGRRSHGRGLKMEEVAVKGLLCNEVRDRKGEPEQAVLEIRYRSLRVLPPIGKQRVCRNALVDVGLSRCALLRRRGSASQANAFSQGPRGRLSHSKHYPADRESAISPDGVHRAHATKERERRRRQLI
jgi:hypothetical protein